MSPHEVMEMSRLFEEYAKEPDPSKREKAFAWGTAIGLQRADGLGVSDFLMDIACRNIEGEISFAEAEALIKAHYAESGAHGGEKADIGEGKADIGGEKPDIGTPKPDIGRGRRRKTEEQIGKLREAFPDGAVFGRSEAMEVLGIGKSRGSELLKEMAEQGVIRPVTGQGKGKYQFM